MSHPTGAPAHPFDALDDRALRNELGEILKHWGVAKPVHATADTAGTMNRTWIVTTVDQRYALKLASAADAQVLLRQYHLVSAAAMQARSAPNITEHFADALILPMRAHSGDICVHHAGLWQLTPFAPGRQIKRDQIDTDHAFALGTFLGELMQTLARVEDVGLPEKSFTVDKARTLADIDRLIAKIIAMPRRRSSADEQAIRRLTERKRWIEQSSDDTSGLRLLPTQPIHGDYQEQNVFFSAAGQVVALIDWDNARMAPREWEVIRTLNFALRFAPDLGCAFVEGYRSRAALDLSALDRVAAAYGVVRSHDLFLFEQIYDLGNNRMQRFLQPGHFVPVYEQWRPLVAALASFR